MSFLNVKSSVLQRISIALFFLCSAGIVYWPLATGNGIFSHGWTLLLHYPAFSAIQKSVQTFHELPLWMTTFYSGFPIFVGNIYGALAPLTLLLASMSDFITAYHAATILATAASLAGVYVFSQELAISRSGSIIAAFTYTFSQFVVYW